MQAGERARCVVETAAGDELAQRPDDDSGKPCGACGGVLLGRLAGGVEREGRGERGFDHVARSGEVGGKGLRECGGEVEHAGLELQFVETSAGQRFEAGGVEAGPGAGQVARGFGDGLTVDQVLEGLGHG
jgi:hypothetical protein